MRETVRIVRVLVSSPGDVSEEREVIERIVDSINRTKGDMPGVRLELFKWELDVVPKLGPGPQSVVDDQTPPYDIYLGIMSSRFGTPTGAYGSGTEKEFRDALERWKRTGSPWVLFYFKDNVAPRPIRSEVNQYLDVVAFREEVSSLGIVGNYASTHGAGGLAERVTAHLRQIVHSITAPEQLADFGTKQNGSDPTRYLRDLLTRCAYIDIRGLQVGTGKAHRFPIEDLYMSLTATSSRNADADAVGDTALPVVAEDHSEQGNGENADTSAKGRRRRSRKARRRPPHGSSSSTEVNVHLERWNIPLHQAMRDDRLVIIGDPGAGKTTFLRRVTHALCETSLGDPPSAAEERIELKSRTFPIYVSVTDLAGYLVRVDGRADAPATRDAPATFLRFLDAIAEENKWSLQPGFFQSRLESGDCTVLIDGLDEAPDRIVRRRMCVLIESVARTYSSCRIVVSTRPSSYIGDGVLDDFAKTRIAPLSDGVVETFLDRWCRALYPHDRDRAGAHYDELLSALRIRPEIRRLARNPVMLTALAVVHWNERRLPEQRADLYESIIRWLSRSREQRPGREKAERAVVLLQELALSMQTHPDGMRTRVSKRWAAEVLAREWASGGPIDKHAIARAEAFLDAEEVDSGIVVARGNDVEFWHRTFQEFLVARAVAARPDQEQQSLLWGVRERLHLAEWREVVLLAAGVLHGQGPAKVDNVVRIILDHLDVNASLPDQARYVGLLGAIFRDLAPVDYLPPSNLSGERYRNHLDRVMGIFDATASARVPIWDRIAAADALGQAGDQRLDFRRDDYWVVIPAGTFWMGAQSNSAGERNYDRDALGYESPVHQVELGAFRIARFPMTVGLYRQFVEGDGYRDYRWWRSGGFAVFREPEGWPDQLEFPSRPVVGVSWYEAVAASAWMGFELPTEAQWERSARGWEGRKFPWGDERPPYQENEIEHAEVVTRLQTEGFSNVTSLNFAGIIGHPTPVGVHATGNSKEGLADLAGNVWEWCRDGFVGYGVEPRKSDGYRGSGAVIQVIRGGSWVNSAAVCRSAYRNGRAPEHRSSNVGFRLATVLRKELDG